MGRRCGGSGEGDERARFIGRGDEPSDDDESKSSES